MSASEESHGSRPMSISSGTGTGIYRDAPESATASSHERVGGTGAGSAAEVRDATREDPEAGGAGEDSDALGMDDTLEKEQPDAQKPKLTPFKHTFFAPELRELRKKYYPPVIFATVLMMVVIWLLFSIYWASVYRVRDNTKNLIGYIINRDSGQIGDAVQGALLDSMRTQYQHLHWIVHSPQEFPTRESIEHAVDPNYWTWMVVEIMENATQKLTTARANGDASWNPQDVVTMIYSTARNYQTVPSSVLQPTQMVLQQAVQKLSASMASQYLASIAGNRAAIEALSRAPQTVANPVGIGQLDMRPWDVPLAIAPTFVGLIYMIILTFQIVMASFQARLPVQNYLTLRSIVALRFLTPVLAYIPISLMYSLINVAFRVPFGRVFPYGGGFMAWWAISYTGMLVCGLTLESVMTVLGPRFVGVFMIFFIITNVSVSNFEVEQMPSFFKYDYAMPFYQLRHMYLTILFNTGKHILILKYIGILWAWLLMIALTMPIFIWWERRQRKKVHFKHLLRQKRAEHGDAPTPRAPHAAGP